MSDVSALPESSRRRFLQALGVTAAAGGMVAAGLGSAQAAPRGRGHRPVRNRTRLVLLGTAGGPVHQSHDHYGVSTAVVYEDRVYVVDLGLGAYRRLIESGLSPLGTGAASLSQVRGIFFTHLHSDHTTDWPAVYATGPMNAVGRPQGSVIEVFGPGDRGTLPRVFPPGRAVPEVVNPEQPTAGISGMTGYLRQAFSQDFNDRTRDSNFPGPESLFHVQDIDLTGIWDVDPAGTPPRLDRPIEVWQDGDVRITATLVDHHPTAPAFAYRFDTPDGSVVVSGDTTVSANLIDLARDTDYLVHEVIDPAYVDQIVASLPPAIGGPLREHLIAAHTTIEQVGRDVAEPAGARNLVLNHLVPADSSRRRWAAAQHGYSGRLIVGEDLLQLGIGR
ncbi:MBL fold metallo-hydrolase [Modestobacter roseus]|nr:MBL fold metallo-hydrolase [Modestobacter roseus]